MVRSSPVAFAAWASTPTCSPRASFCSLRRGSSALARPRSESRHMRDALRELQRPDHVGLAYGAWAPVARDGSSEQRGKVPDATRADWLDSVAAIPVSRDYVQAFQ